MSSTTPRYRPVALAQLDEGRKESFRLPPDTLDAYPRALVDSSLEKVLASAVFRRSDRHRRFMRYIVRMAQDGQRDRLKEVLLGVELFGRKLDHYDPRFDPIVRVEAGRIRDKLARYYDGEGADDEFVFAIPVGSYLPQFTRRIRPVGPARMVESYAVMPFTGDATEEDVTFTTSLADQLINLIGQLKDVKVVGRLSTLRVREQKLGINALGKLLNVTRLVEGSVQRQGGRRRCFAQVYRTRDGTLLWSHSFDSKDWEQGPAREFDVFAFQDHIVETVLRWVSTGQVVVDSTPAVSTRDADGSKAARYEARDLVARTTYLARRYDTVSNNKVIEQFERAIVLDPTNATAQIELATACFHRASAFNGPGDSVLPRIERAVDRALVLDPTNGEAIALRATVFFRMKLDWPTADTLFREALRNAPHNGTVNYRYAFAMICNGDFEVGLRHSRTALELDPLNLGLRAWRAQLLAYSRNYAQAEAEARGVLELEPEHLYMNNVLALIHLYRGEYPQAMRVYDAVVARQPDYFPAQVGRIMTFGLQGDLARGRHELDALILRFAGRYCSPFCLALAHVCLGDFDASDAALDRAVHERDPGLCSLPIDPLFEVRHAEPGFVAWLARRGLRSPVS